MTTPLEVTNTPSLEEALQQAFDAEVTAFETYNAVVEKFGAVFPFVSIIEAQQTHQNALVAVAAEHNIALVRNTPLSISLPKTVQECCELGVAGEIKTIQLCDGLLLHVKEYADVQDLFYRLQAASYNNHLPAFRNAVSAYASAHHQTNANPMAAIEGMMGQWGEFSHMAQKIARGEVSQEEITKLLSTNVSFIAGALLGVVGAGVLGSMIVPDEETKEEEKD